MGDQLTQLLIDRIDSISTKLDGIETKVGETRECVASMKTKIELYLGNGKDGEFQRLQNTVRSHDKVITRAGVYAGIIAAVVSALVTFVIATHDHWVPAAKPAAAIVQTK